MIMSSLRFYSERSTWDLSLCGESFELWSGKCSSIIIWILPSYFLLTLISAIYMGKLHETPVSLCRVSLSIHGKLVLTSVLFSLPIISLLNSYFMHLQIFMIDYVSVFIRCFCWLIHFGYLTKLPLRKSHGHRLINILYVICLASSGYDLYVHNHKVKLENASQYMDIISFVVQILYVGTFFCKAPAVQREFGSISSANEEQGTFINEPLMVPFHQPGEHVSPLGVAEYCSVISKLFLFWVFPLLMKGFHKNIKTSDDLFELPLDLQADHISSQLELVVNNLGINMHDDSNTSHPHGTVKKFHLFQVLRCNFGVEYFMLGSLKLLSDCLIFSGPLLLNLIVSFLENNEKTHHGYLYALALFLVTFFNAFCSTHYNYLVNRVSYKIRSALVLLIYRKTLKVSQFRLSDFTSGEIYNFMSSDTDRVINFCPSFHQFWSLPLQIGITLYLLYLQIGFSFFVGLIFAVLLIPVNQFIARQIGIYSELMMCEKDKRIKLINEALNGIKVIKMQALETAFSEKIERFRNKELYYLKKRKYLDAFCVYFWATTPVIMSVLTFTCYALMGNTLTASRIFTSIALFNMLITPLNAFPWVLNGLVESFISLKRLGKFLELPELNLKRYYTAPKNRDAMIEIVNGVFMPSHVKPKTSTESDPACDTVNDEGNLSKLGPIDVSFLKGKFVCVVGKVGSGKSTLLSAILGDVPKVEGSVYFSISDRIKGVGFVPQEPWIMQASIRHNITFGRSMDDYKYDLVLKACALVDDLKILPFGDETEVGGRGITLSGGQKTRIALARAVYQDMDLYLLDDPFSSVDVHVAEHILRNCVLDLLRHKTCIICTHRTSILENADAVIYLESGKISEKGRMNIMSCVAMTSSNDNAVAQHEEPTTSSMAADINEKVFADTDDDIAPELYETQEIKYDEKVEDGGYFDEEKDEKKGWGYIKFSVYLSYWKAIGANLARFVLFSCFLMQASRTLCDWWLSMWISDFSDKSNNNSQLHDKHLYLDRFSSKNLSSNSSKGMPFYLSVYGGIAVSNTIFTALRAFSFAYCGIKAAATLHRQLKAIIFSAPVSYFCKTPVGRILNRFSTDVYNVDDTLPFQLNIFLAQLFGLFGCLVVVCYSLPYMIILLVILSVFYYVLQFFYRRTSRELKRISSVTLSPLYAHFSETIDGQTTIRASGAADRFREQNFEKINSYQRAALSIMAASQWLNLQLQFVGVIVVTSVAVIALLENEYSSINSALVGLALSYALSITGLLNGVVTSFTETEKEIVSVERIAQYIEDVPSENETATEVPFLQWPSQGVIVFKRVFLKYKPDDPYALENVSFIVVGAEKIGIVGRTGSGKSSLIQALFRMAEIESGEIIVDNVNIATIEPQYLRSHLSIVPQDPFLFSGTVRENLDPNNIYYDAKLFRVLEHCNMDNTLMRKNGLATEVEEGGRNFSVGERQLLCLAKILLDPGKILCLDEATSNIDQLTSSEVFERINFYFRHSTVFIIAHRMETIMVCDRVMVMEGGKLIEFDKPSTLLHRRSSEFYKLVYNIR